MGITGAIRGGVAALPTTRGGFTPAGWAAFAACTLIWGSTWLVIKSQLGEVPPSWSVTWRFVTAALAMVVLCRVTGKSLRLTRGQHGFAMVFALLQFVLNFNLIYRAEQHLPSGLVSLAFAMLVVPNTLFGAVFLGQRVTGRFLAGAGIGIVGVALLVGHDMGASGGSTRLGMVLALLAVLCASAANILQASPAGRALPMEAGLAWAMGYAGIGNAVFAWGVSGPPQFDFSPGYVAGVAYLGIFASALAFQLYYRLIREVGPGQAAYNGVVVPVVAMALSTLFEGYDWSLPAVIGGSMALAGLVIALRAR